MSRVRKHITTDRPDLNKLDIGDIISRLGMRVSDQRNGWFTTWCIFHNDGKNPNLRINETGGVFKCFSCGATGNILHLVEQLLSTDRDGAWQYLSSARESVPTLESLRNKLRHRGTKKKYIDYDEIINKHIVALQKLLKTMSPLKMDRLLSAHLNFDTHEYFLLVDPDYYLLKTMIFDLIDNSFEYEQRLSYGDKEALSEFLAYVREIWLFAQHSGYIERHPKYYTYIQDDSVKIYDFLMINYTEDNYDFLLVFMLHLYYIYVLAKNWNSAKTCYKALIILRSRKSLSRMWVPKNKSGWVSTKIEIPILAIAL